MACGQQSPGVSPTSWSLPRGHITLAVMLTFRNSLKTFENFQNAIFVGAETITMGQLLLLFQEAKQQEKNTGLQSQKHVWSLGSPAELDFNCYDKTHNLQGGEGSLGS